MGIKQKIIHGAILLTACIGLAWSGPVATTWRANQPGPNAVSSR